MFSIYMSCVDDDGWGHQREKNAIRKKGFHHLGKEKVVLLQKKNPRFVPEFCFKNNENSRLIVYEFGNREFLSSIFQNEKIS